jgi:hypothetical protein
MNAFSAVAGYVTTRGQYILSSERVEDNRKCQYEGRGGLEGAAELAVMRNVVSQLQVHVPALSAVLSDLCRNHSNIFLDRFQQFDMWALKSKHFVMRVLTK